MELVELDMSEKSQILFNNRLGSVGLEVGFLNIIKSATNNSQLQNIGAFRPLLVSQHL